MARGKVVGGGNYNDWLAFAEHEPLVMMRRIRQLADKDLGNGLTEIVLTDSVICTGPDAGKITIGEEMAGKGMVNELLRQNDGDDLPCKVVIRTGRGREYPAIVSITAEEEAQIDELFPVGEEDEVWAEVKEKDKATRDDADDAPRGRDNGSSRRGRDDDAPRSRQSRAADSGSSSGGDAKPARKKPW